MEAASPFPLCVQMAKVWYYIGTHCIVGKAVTKAR